MSFSSSIKEDLVKLRLKSPSLRLSELAGLTLCCGSLYVGRGAGAVYSTETLSVGRLIVALATELYHQLDVTIELSERERRRNALTIVTLIGTDAEKLLTDTGLIVPTIDGFSLGDSVPQRLIGCPEDAQAFLRGVFLGSGSCTNPSRGYHLELVTRSESIAELIVSLIANVELTARCHRRKEKVIVYLKSEDVSGFLALLGASKAALAFENIRAEKEFRNYVNRTSNCETANIGKTVDAAVAQTHAIEIIERVMELGKLPASLYEAAMLRLNHPDATLQELADLAEIGKSGMNHRLTRLLKLAEEIDHG
ncbi:MAG: DNA-binding protein WhiA [Clostridia bacterium]